MKAVIFKKFGDPTVLQFAELTKPVPRNNEVLVRINATSVTAEDPKMRGFNHPPLLKLPVGIMFGFKKPKRPVLGIEFSGTVEALGKNVTTYKVNDEVFGYTGLSFGAYAAYKCLPENSIMSLKPKNFSFEAAATLVNGPLSALAFLKKKGAIKERDRVLIYGASGSVGTAAVQLARYFGAEVTGVCSTRNIELVRSLGATQVIDYTKEDFRRTDKRYDIIFDTVGKTTIKDCMSLLQPKGKYLLTEFGLPHIITMLYTSLFKKKKVIVAASNLFWKKEDLVFLKEIAENGSYTPVIDKSFPLSEIVEAHRYVEAGHKTGNVAIEVQGDQ